MIDLGGGRYRPSRWLLSGVAAGLVFALVLGGCGGDDSDDPPDSGLPSEGETASPTTTAPTDTPTETTPTEPSPPSVPAVAAKPGRSGAKAFVRFYVGLENYAKDTGDVAPLRQYSHPQCGGCNDYIRFYRDWYERGGWFKEGDRTIASFDRAVPAVAPHDMYVRISGLQKVGDFRERHDAPVKTARREAYTWLIWLIREPRGWRVSRLDVPR
ncbi:MAG TPA: DUF6318 family protein [Nocardioidaceae bacterium]|nr:DUF6318 family protein [Nocardioidaceae bacterium]